MGEGRFPYFDHNTCGRRNAETDQFRIAIPEKLDQLNLEIGAINDQLTPLEDEFSFTLGEGARWLENLILKLLFSVALTVEITGLIFTISVTRNITRGLNEINKAANKITAGQLNARATVFSKDEIGQVATSVNKMAEQLDCL